MIKYNDILIHVFMSYDVCLTNKSTISLQSGDRPLWDLTLTEVGSALQTRWSTVPFGDSLHSHLIPENTFKSPVGNQSRLRQVSQVRGPFVRESHGASCWTQLDIFIYVWLLCRVLVLVLFN